MIPLKISKHRYTQIFGGMGFNNMEALMYPAIEKEHFDQILCKCYREIAPGFMRTFSGYVDQTKESMDSFAEYYNRMQKITDTPIFLTTPRAKVHFNEREMEDYCERVADNLVYMKREKGINHLRYYSFSGEMSRGDWGVLINDLPTYKRYHELLYSAFQKRNLDMGLLATEATGYPCWDTMDWAIRNMSPITEDYSLHIYDQHNPHDLSFYDFFYSKCQEKVAKAIRNSGKRLILSEIGIQDSAATLTYGNGYQVDICRYYDNDDLRPYCGLMLVEMAFSAINAGVYAFAYWSYSDLPDPYSCAYSEKPGFAKAWGECERFVIAGTTDVRYNKWGSFRWEDNGDFSPREFWFAIGPMIKLFKRNGKVLTIETPDPLLRCCGIYNRDGSVSIGVVNRNRTPIDISLESDLFNKAVRVYEYDPENVAYNRFGDLQAPNAVLPANEGIYTLKPYSVTFFTTDYQEKKQALKAQNVKVNPDKLIWDAVSDPDHCYYRVYADEREEFVPGPSNQVASTVACDLPIKDGRLHYKVLSVDQWGNA